MSFDIVDYLMVVENAIPDGLCDEILTEYKEDSNWINTEVSGGLQRDIRRCDAIDITAAHIVNQNKDARLNIDTNLYNCVSNCIKKYSHVFPKMIAEGDSGYVLLRYQEGEFYAQHTDHFLQQPRIVSCSFALNDDYEGGEWGFWDRKKVLKVPKGSAIMFPSNFMYPHEIMPVTRGVRYSVITWFI